MGGVNDNSTLAKLVRLRALTRTTGVMHEVQVEQLRLWPYLADGWILPGGVEIGVDMERKRLAYKWTSEPPKGPLSSVAEFRRNRTRVGAAYKKGLDGLTGWIRNLLGDDWSVDIELDGKPIYRNEGGEIQDARPEPGSGSGVDTDT